MHTNGIKYKMVNVRANCSPNERRKVKLLEHLYSFPCILTWDNWVTSHNTHIRRQRAGYDAVSLGLPGESPPRSKTAVMGDLQAFNETAVHLIRKLPVSRITSMSKTMSLQWRPPLKYVNVLTTSDSGQECYTTIYQKFLVVLQQYGRRM